MNGTGTTGTATSDTGVPALQVTDIEAGYDQTQVLRGVSLTVPAASVTALVGPNGAGKSTLLKTISGLIKPTKGTITVHGEDVTALAPNKRTRRGVCHIPEGRAVYRRLTVRENIIMQAEKGQEAAAMELAAQAFPRLGERLAQQAGTLSGGEQQMLALARAYVRKQRLILVDEASLGLAPLLVDAIFEFLQQQLVKERGVALLIVDQFVHRALDMADTAYVMRRGEIAFGGPASELQGSDVFAHYLGGDGAPT
ncbi:MAG: ABC transporter ATP-binding protein [Ilumatobacteraceae bacterium]